MKHSQLVWTAFALWAAAGTATLASACDQKTSSASAASAVACPSGMSAAACKSAGMSCQSKGASASAASMTAISADHCTGKSAAASASTAAMNADHCAGKNAAASASVAAMSADHCAGKTAAVSAAGCPAHGSAAAAAACKKAASAASAASAAAMVPHCRGEGLVKFADASVHADCEGCADMARCAQEIAGAGARVQVVPLKNGVMYVYTAESSSGVRVVQAAVAHRNERLASWTTAGDRVHLCSECKAMRGAAASGKLNREVINIEGGCLTLMTSSDPAIVARLHQMAAASLAASRTKS